MKLRTLILAASVITLASCYEPQKTASDVTVVTAPDGTRTAFVTQYPNATNVVWSSYSDGTMIPIDWDLTGWTALDNKDYLVRFDMDNEPYYAWYDSDGNWIGTAYVMSDYKGLPSAVNTTITTQYPAYTITGVNREFQKDRMAYEVELKNGNTKTKLLVDGNGNIIKSKTKTIQ
jgi:hypothetical protein